MGFKPRKRPADQRAAEPDEGGLDDDEPVIAAYVRVSSRGQDDHTQRAAIARAAAARGDRIDAWYAEQRSASQLARPELDRVRADARAGKLRKLYLFRLDRLTRSGIRDTLHVVDELRRHGCQLVSVSDGFDLDGPAAEIVLAVMAWAARIEREAIGERIRAARARLAARGEAWGRPRRMTADQVRRARDLQRRGKSIRAIAIALKVPKSTIQRALTRE